MSPRHTAAENTVAPHDGHVMIVGFNEAAAYSRGKPLAPDRGVGGVAGASMRPRHTAAENRRRRLPGEGEAPAASMRPRHTAAENRQPRRLPVRGRCASMRPRHTAAENRKAPAAAAVSRSSFNEAAAYSRGKPCAGRPH